MNTKINHNPQIKQFSGENNCFSTRSNCKEPQHISVIINQWMIDNDPPKPISQVSEARKLLFQRNFRPFIILERFSKLLHNRKIS